MIRKDRFVTLLVSLVHTAGVEATNEEIFRNLVAGGAIDGTMFAVYTGPDDDPRQTAAYRISVNDVLFDDQSDDAEPAPAEPAPAEPAPAEPAPAEPAGGLMVVPMDPDTRERLDAATKLIYALYHLPVEEIQPLLDRTGFRVNR